MRRTHLALALALALAFVPGCGDDSCGTDGAPPDGLTVVVDGVAVSYGQLVAGANNDCPNPAAPDGVVSLTIAGTQVGGSSILTLCVPRPDLLTDGARVLGTDVQIEDVFAEAGGCSYADLATPAATGTASATGVCSDGIDPAGFALTLDGALTMQKTCGAEVTQHAATITGTVAVTPQ